MKWAGKPHFEEMKWLAPRSHGPAIEQLLDKMLPMDSDETLKLAGEMFPNLSSQSYAINFLRRQGAAAEPTLIPILSHQDQYVRRKAAEFLNEHGTQDSLAPLQKQLAQEDDRRTRLSIEAAIANIQERSPGN